MFFKVIRYGFIIGIGTGPRGIEITQEEYTLLTDIFHKKPSETESVGYRLNANSLEWESYEKGSEPDIIDDSEALEILLGGAS